MEIEDIENEECTYSCPDHGPFRKDTEVDTF